MQLSLALDPDPLLAKVRDRLLQVFGPQRDEERHDPLSQLVKAMISVRTLDAISQAAFVRLMTLFPSWEALASADPEVIAHIIRDVTRAPDRARFLVATFQMLQRQLRYMNLDALSEWPVEAALAHLRDLPGVGPKTAAAVVSFSTLRQRVFVVDTHCLRVAVRLALLPPKASFERAHQGLMRLMPDDWNADELYELHWLMKRLGQEYCTHGSPRCSNCPLRHLCHSRKAMLDPDPWALRMRPVGRQLVPAGAPEKRAY